MTLYKVCPDPKCGRGSCPSCGGRRFVIAVTIPWTEQELHRVAYSGLSGGNLASLADLIDGLRQEISP